MEDIMDWIKEKNGKKELLDFMSVDYLSRRLGNAEVAKRHIGKMNCVDGCTGAKDYIDQLEKDSEIVSGLLCDYVKNWLCQEGLKTYNEKNTEDPYGFMTPLLESGKLASMDDKEPIVKAYVAITCYLLRDFGEKDLKCGIPKDRTETDD